ncbi:MAG: 3-methyl-2-oxobutanoate hydroxymethyltransferase [Bdellovibrionota bacterium]
MKSIFDFFNKKKQAQKISMITCYDYSWAKLINKSPIDAVLVGDSAAMVMHGEKTTVPATMEMMIEHCKAVVKGCPDKFVIGDMPFASYRIGFEQSMLNMQRIMQTGVSALKLEGAQGHLDLVAHAVQSGIPVMGHLGLTPQSVFQLGGFKVQGKDSASQEKIMQDALALEKAGCFSLVLECVPSALAEKIAKALTIPVIGIGAGANVDGQVLVLQDLMGFQTDFSPKFVRKYFNAANVFAEVFGQYHKDVTESKFPSHEESYDI